MRRAIAAIVLAAFLAGAPAAEARLRVAAVVRGHVSNGTEGAPAPAGLVVTAVLTRDGEERGRWQATTGPDGAYRMELVVISAALLSGRLVVGTDYLGVTYSLVVDLSEAKTDIEAGLTVFETTQDDAGISVASDTLTIVRGREDTLEVLQVQRVRNAGDRTYVGHAEGVVLRLPFPPGAFDLSPGDGLVSRDLGPVGEGFTTNDPVLPGETTISYLYKVRVPRTGWALRRAVFYPTERIDLLLGSGLSLRAPAFAFQEEVKLGGRRYRRYRAGPLVPAAAVEAGILFAAAPSRGLPWGIAAGVGAALVLTLLPRLRRGRRPLPAPIPSDRERLIDEIAALDDAFAAGSVPEPEYRRARGLMKSRLAERSGDAAR